MGANANGWDAKAIALHSQFQTGPSRADLAVDESFRDASYRVEARGNEKAITHFIREELVLSFSPMKRSASAVWQGGLKDGKGAVSTESGVLSRTPYSFSTRFEGQPGTNPEELIAAAHAGCFSMALSGELGKAGMVPVSIETSAVLTMDRLEAGWTVTAIHLDVSVKIPGADPVKFQAAAKAAETGCPISRLLMAKITMDAKLAS
jgi:osmotically inducible protein OsmC